MVRQTETKWAVMNPVTCEEVNDVLKRSSESSPGPDKLCLRHLRSLDPKEFACAFNLWLLHGYVPHDVLNAETILVFKNGDNTVPGNYRPITIASLMIRMLHRILAHRLEVEVPSNPRQKAFKRVDGCADNIYLLDTILKEAKKKIKPVCLAFFDVSKAFDSVSHHTIRRALLAHGVPPPLIEYVSNLYARSTTSLKVKGRRGASIRCNRGVRQGDLLLSLIFNFVIDEVINSLDAGIGFTTSDNQVIGCLAYADDLILVATTRKGLANQTRALERSLGTGGLTLNVQKSATLEIKVDGKAKQWVVCETPFLSIGG